MKIYRIAKEYKKAQIDIQFLGELDFAGAHVVQFKIGDDYWVYRLSFPEWIAKVKQIAKYSPGKALAYAKQKKSDAFKVTKDFPQPGSIIREELSKEKETKGE